MLFRILCQAKEENIDETTSSLLTEYWRLKQQTAVVPAAGQPRAERVAELVHVLMMQYHGSAAVQSECLR